MPLLAAWRLTLPGRQRLLWRKSMRTGLLLVMVLLGGLPRAAFAQDAECRAIVEKAIKAHGVEKAAKSLKAIHAKGKGVVNVQNMDLDFTIELFSNIPNQSKVALTLTIMNMKIDIVQVNDGDKGWASFNGQVKDLNDDQLREAKEKKYIESVTGLGALKDKVYQLSPLGESKVDDRPVVGIQVSQKDKGDVNLFFDKQTHMLLKSQYRYFHADSGQEVDEEKFIQEYKEVVPGLKTAVKMTIKKDGVKSVELELTEFQAVEPHDASIFAKPK
jgi:hypothetical protein